MPHLRRGAVDGGHARPWHTRVLQLFRCGIGGQASSGTMQAAGRPLAGTPRLVSCRDGWMAKGWAARDPACLPARLSSLPPRPAVPAADHSGHGTHTSGIIGALANNLLGVAGVAWNVSRPAAAGWPAAWPCEASRRLPVAALPAAVLLYCRYPFTPAAVLLYCRYPYTCVLWRGLTCSSTPPPCLTATPCASRCRAAPAQPLAAGSASCACGGPASLGLRQAPA